MPSSAHPKTSGSRSPRGPGLWLGAALASLFIGIGMLARESTGTGVETTAEAPTGSKQRMNRRDAPAPEDDHPRARRGGSSAASVVEAFLTTLRAEPDPDKRQALLKAFLDQCPGEEIRNRLNDLCGLSEDALVREAGIAFLRRWAADDVRAAAAWAERLPAGAFREEALAGVAIEWANTSLLDAAAWANHLADPPEHDRAVLAVANEAVRSNPLEVLRMAEQLPANPQQEELMRRAAMEWASQDGPAAAGWARQLPDGPERDRLMAAIATAWSSRDPIAAAEMATLEIPAGRAQADAVMGIVQRWGQSEPGLAAAWVDRFPAGDLKQTAWENLELLREPEPVK